MSSVNPIKAGLSGRCPNCGKGRMFRGFLKVVETCETCGFDFTRLNTGDGPASFIMQISGFLVVFPALYIQIVYEPPIWLLLLVAVPLVALLSLALMRPGKGLMIALQMRNKMDGSA